MNPEIKYTVATTYAAMQNEARGILESRGVTKKDHRVIVSMFEEISYSETNWKVKSIDFDSPFCAGKVKFLGDRDYNISEEVTNPTWKDVIFYANQSILHGMKVEELDGWDHVFLESVEFKEEKNGIKIFEFWFGS